jgi:hypothetical protein
MAKKETIAGAAEAAAPAKTKKLTIPTESFEADGVEYKFTAAAFVLDGETIRASDALKKAEILAKLVQIKAGVIAPVEKED